MSKFSIATIFPGFYSGEIDEADLEKIIQDVVGEDHPLDKIKNMKYTKDGVIIVLDSGQVIEIDIDWDEIILKR